jgi:hypothetical protein
MNFRVELEAVLEVISSTSASHMASEVFIPFEGAEIHTYINIERINIERRNNKKSKHLYTQLNPTPPILKIPRSRLEITVHSVRRPYSVNIAFKVLASFNYRFQMRHSHLSSLLKS